MKKDRYERLEAVFLEAVELEDAARREFLDRACAGDADLRRSVELLLSEDEDENGAGVEVEAGRGRDLLADAVQEESEKAGPDQPAAPRVSVPTKIGRYVIQDTIAEGGMGAVYLAEQDHPRRPVALKMIRPGAFSEETLRRFKFEAELLGRLQHPGIARIYEAGEAETDTALQPFFAMEYIEGVELRRYAQQHGLDIPARLELMARVCDAVNHAHQKGIVHRDLKPDNILVVEEPATTSSSSSTTSGSMRVGQPKVLDFGVARVTNSDVQATTMHTEMCQFIGTLAYMSPEQVTGDPRKLDTRSDIYSLGVILYELLAGRPPFDLSRRSIPEAARMIRDQEPPRISSINAAFRGDVDAILLKALDKDRERRYASAAVLADDIRRYLADQPITARPPTLPYQLSRFIRRNKVLVGSSLVALVCLVAGLVLALLSQKEEARQRRVAERQTENARRSAYAAQIQAAMAYRMAGDRRAARRQLATTPTGLRGWEWDHLSSTTGDDLYFFPMRIETGISLPAATSGESRVLFPVDEKTLRLFDVTTRTWSDHPYPGQGHRPVALLPGRSAALLGDSDGWITVAGLDPTSVPRRVWKADDPIRAICIAPDRVHAAVLCTKVGKPPDWSVRILDLESYRVTASLRGLPTVSWQDFSPDGSRLALAMREADVLVCDTATLGRLHTFRGHVGTPFRVCFSPTGSLVASSGYYDRTIRIWSLESRRELQVLGPVQYWASSIAFHPDGQRLVSGHAGARIRIWNLETGTCERLTSGGDVSDPLESPIHHLRFMKEGGLVCALGLDGIYIRPLEDPFPAVLRHEMCIHSYAYDVDFSPSGRHLASAGWDGTVRIWDVATRRALAVVRCPENARRVRYSPDGERLLICSQLGYNTRIIRLWNVKTLQREHELRFKSIHAPELFVPRCESILLGALSEIWVVDPLTLTVRDKRTTPAEVWSLALSPDGMRVACGLRNGECLVLHAESLERLAAIKAHEKGIQAVAYAPDGTRLATGAEDARIGVWDARSGEKLLRFEVPGARELFTLRFTPDGRRILSGSRRVSIGVWDAQTGLELVRLPGHQDYVHALASSPDGRIVASASGDNTVRIWDARSLLERVEEKNRMLAAERAIRGRVKRLLDELGSIDKALAAIEADPTLGPLETAAAWNVVHLSQRPQ